MTVQDPGRIPVGLFDGASISDDAVQRLSAGAARIVAFADGADASAITGQWSRVAPSIDVEIVPAVSDIREAIIECARRKVIWLAAPTPKNAGRFVAGALQGAAAATEFEIPSVAVHVLRDETVEGSVAWLTQTGEMSGYGVFYAAAVAAMGGRSVTLISPQPCALLGPRRRSRPPRGTSRSPGSRSCASATRRRCSACWAGSSGRSCTRCSTLRAAGRCCTPASCPPRASRTATPPPSSSSSRRRPVT